MSSPAPPSPPTSFIFPREKESLGMVISSSNMSWHVPPLPKINKQINKVPDSYGDILRSKLLFPSSLIVFLYTGTSFLLVGSPGLGHLVPKSQSPRTRRAFVELD